jgi:hypothetical protein
MIHEFAVEPEVMATWQHFNVLWDDFGVSRGRLLVECPKSWRKHVYELVDRLTPKPVRANAIKAKLGDTVLRRSKVVGADARTWDGECWREAALRQQQGERPFRAVVLREAPTGRPDCLTAGEFERDAEPWKVERQSRCPRLAAQMRQRVERLLAHSEELVVVDRFFDPCKPEFVRPFEAFVGVRSFWKRLEIHTALPDPFRPDPQEANYRRGLNMAVPEGTTLVVYLWPGLPRGERLHPRFILTERGGVQFDYGLDEGQSQADTTLVTLLEHGVFRGLCEDYCATGRKFGDPRQVLVQGRG